MDNNITVRVLPRNLIHTKPAKSTLQWLIGSQFHPQFTIISTIQCLYYHHRSNLPSPDPDIEAEHLRSLIIKGFHVIGALVSSENGELGLLAKHAFDWGRKIREVLYRGEKLGDFDLICGVGGCGGGEIRFFVERVGGLSELKVVESVDEPEKFVWDRGCLIRCEMNLKLPIFVPMSNDSVAIEKYNNANEALIAKFKDPQITFIAEAVKGDSDNLPRPVIIRGSELDFETDVQNVSFEHVAKSEGKALCCSYFFSDSKHYSSMLEAENADTIQVTAYLNKSEKLQQTVAPVAEYCPAGEDTVLKIVDYKLDVLCYAVKNLPLTDAISRLVVPALVDQVTAMKNAILPSFLSQHPQLRPYHFYPPGILNPITAIYELSYGETELKQVEARRSLHLRLGLPTDRPLLRIANALNFGKPNSNERASGTKGYMLKDVHLGIPGSGVSGGLASLVQGSYEYHHYLQDGFDDSGWGCAYRSLQTIISWFKLQHYTSIDVPTHREIQKALVEIGDKDPSFVGSREWIGAIELSYVLDKLLGVTCKVINVRSGAELPEKCRELALHFESQGTPIMIGGGVLAYTLLGVDYNNDSGDSAFLILDPHYTGGEDLKKIVNGGWCGWKKAIDNKGKSFFLHDKFYNLLLPQRPDMV